MNSLLCRQESILSQALALPAEEQSAYVRRACGGDEALRAAVDELLDAGRAAQGFLEKPPAALAPELAGSRRRSGEGPGDRVGRYRLLEKIGEGGAGVVYAAEQLEPVHRHVALKILKSEQPAQPLRAQFVAECQTLAWMEHPNIARVFDAGTTDDGRPYLAMELVRGLRLTDYCDENRLPLAERVALLIPVCLAVHHAHRKGVIHRDLKPSNILVTVHDGVPVPKVIDFGIAQAEPPPGFDAGCDRSPKRSDSPTFVGTPHYLSPEQSEPGAPPVDARSDVYSLGVVLYELITGSTPISSPLTARADFDVLRRRLHEEEPLCPSRRLASLDTATLRGRAQQRGVSADQLLREARGPLDWITLHCLEKRRTRRYPTAAALAAALQRCIAGEFTSDGTSGILHAVGRLIRQRRKPAVGPACRAPTANQAAYVAYLRGRRHAERSFNREDFEAAVAAFEEATRLDPDFALAWAHLSMAHGAMYWFTYLDPTAARLARCKAAVDEALRLDPDLPEAHLTLGVYHYRGFRDWEQAQRELEIAHRRLPDDARVLCHLGLNERRMGHWADSTAHFAQAVAFEPRNTTAWGGLIDNHGFHRRHEEVLAAGARALSFASDDRLVRRALAWNRFALDGDRGALFAGLEASSAPPPDDARDRAELALLRGDYDRAARVLDAARAQSFRDHHREIAKAELQAVVARLCGDETGARSLAANAAGFYGASMLHREPDEIFALSSLGRALALMGRADEALDYGRRAMARLPVARDALWGPEIMAEHALTCLIAGALDEALTHLAAVVRLPYETSAHELRLHPLWGRCTGDARFENILASIGPLPDPS